MEAVKFEKLKFPYIASGHVRDEVTTRRNA